MDPRVAACELVNEPGGDSGLYVELVHKQRAFLFDCGDLSNLPPRQRLRAGDVFISHTHMDHFIGFDQLYRAALGLEHRIRVHGPPPIAAQVHHRLLGYTWNLIEPPDVRFEVRELTDGEAKQFEIGPQDQYQELHERGMAAIEPTLAWEDEEVRVERALLEHTTPSYGYALQLGPRWHVDAKKLKEAGYLPGPWVGELLDRLKSPEVSKKSTVRVASPSGDKEVPIGDLTAAFLSRSPGCRIAYVTDTRFSERVVASVAELARNADLFFCEAVFLTEDKDRAKRTHHLTAAQCGELARAAGAKTLKTFHYSRRYQESERLLDEVRAVFPNAE